MSSKKKELTDLELQIKYDQDLISLKSELQSVRQKYYNLLKKTDIADRILEYTKQNIKALPSVKAPVLQKKDFKKNQETAVLVLSCLHIGEVVKPEQIDYLNKYDFRTFVQRLQFVVDKTIKFTLHNMNNYQYDELVVMMTGDMVSGDVLHEELAETNEINVVQQVHYGSLVMAQALLELAQVFPKIRCVGVVGNHGRIKKDKYFKDKQNMSFDYMFYQSCAALLVNQKNIEWQIPQTHWADINIEGKKFHIVHGDLMGGSGSPIAKLEKEANKIRGIKSAVGDSVDYLVSSHYHSTGKMQIPTGEVMLNACFPPGELVTIENYDRVPIESLKIGDKVLTRSGKMLPINHCMVKEFDGYLVNFRLGSNDSLVRCTPNHGIWAIKENSLNQSKLNGGHERSDEILEPKWIPSEFLGCGDYVKISRSVESLTPTWEDKEFCRFFGIYLAEGSVSGADGNPYQVTTTHHIKEKSISKRVCNYLESRWGKTPTETERPDKNTRTVVLSSKDAGEEMVRLAGRGSLNKRICDDLMKLPPELQLEILLGWIEGDGHIAAQSYRGGRYVSATSISRKLINQMHQIAVRCGFAPTIYRMSKGGPRKHDSYTLGFMANDAAKIAKLLEKPFEKTIKDKESRVIWVAGDPYYKITEIYREGYKGPIHNIEVDQDHSYTVSGVTVKNSMKGTDEYSRALGYHSDPIQILFSVNRKYGKTWSIDINTKHAPDFEPRYKYDFKKGISSQLNNIKLK